MFIHIYIIFIYNLYVNTLASSSILGWQAFINWNSECNGVGKIGQIHVEK